MYGYDIVDNPIKENICRKKTKICMHLPLDRSTKYFGDKF